jgi:two-component system chemotaxis response regulator CheY
VAKILVVDDSQTVRLKLRKDLAEAGHEVVEGKDGADGLLKFKENPGIQLVLCDVNMPNMDGLTMCDFILKEPGQKNLPIIMLTTEANSEMKETAKSIGVKAWIVKPYDTYKLLNAVNSLLKT